ncbi:hypothetical protein [Paenibacillus faecalis]|uniref:hypothetical protein n=1 Tax=Paenibacillus faecalis TaxID=2079532 RepID=UPI000D111C14|nr:hypothetical protein [Paenibacillus faecalis]
MGFSILGQLTIKVQLTFKLFAKKLVSGEIKCIIAGKLPKEENIADLNVLLQLNRPKEKMWLI